MPDSELKKRLQTLHKNLNILEERKAKYGLDVPLSLRNQIEDHQTAIKLVEQAIEEELSEQELLDGLAPLNLGLDGRVQNVFQSIQAIPKPALIIALVISIIIIVLLFLISPQGQIFVPRPTPTPLFTTPAELDEILILIAEFKSKESEPTYIVGERIYNELDAQISQAKLSNVRLEFIPAELTPKITTDARKLGQVYSSTFIIWGLIDEARIDAHFSITDPASEDLAGLSPIKKLRDPLDLREFNIFVGDELPNQITFLATFAIGQIYFRNDNYQEAERIFELGLENSLQDIPKETLANVHFYRGYTAHNLGQLEKALEQYEQAIALAPSLYQAHYNRGVVHQNLGLFEEAISDFSNAIANKPDLIIAYINRGSSFEEQEKLPEALADFNTVLDLDPTAVFALLDRGFVYQKMGEPDRALADYNHAVELAPDSLPLLYFNRATLYQQQGDYEQAATDYRKFLELDPEHESQTRFEALVFLGWVYYLMGNYQAAIETNQASLAAHSGLNPGAPGFLELVYIRYNLALALLANGQPALAEAEYEQALRLTTDPELVEAVIVDIENLLMNQPDTPGAVEIIEKLRAGKF